MRLHQIEGGEVADALVEFGRAAQVGEQEGQAGDLQALVDVERVGAVDVAEGLVGEQPLGGEERPALAEQCRASASLATHTDGQRAHARRGFRARCAAARAAIAWFRCGGAPRSKTSDDRLALLGRLALDVDELRGVGHRLENDDEARRQAAATCTRLFAGRQFERLDRRTRRSTCVEIVLRQIDARAPVDLAEIFGRATANGDRARRCGARAG